MTPRDSTLTVVTISLKDNTVTAAKEVDHLSTLLDVDIQDDHPTGLD